MKCWCKSKVIYNREISIKGLIMKRGYQLIIFFVIYMVIIQGDMLFNLFNFCFNFLCKYKSKYYFLFFLVKNVSIIIKLFKVIQIINYMRFDFKVSVYFSYFVN